MIVKKVIGKEAGNLMFKIKAGRYHMSDINAAIGRAQLKRFYVMANKRKLICKHYDKFFQNIKIILIYLQETMKMKCLIYTVL